MLDLEKVIPAPRTEWLIEYLDPADKERGFSVFVGGQLIAFQSEWVTLLQGDALEWLKRLPKDAALHTLTSPPYYQMFPYTREGEYGREKRLGDYLRLMRRVFMEVNRIVPRRGVLDIIIGDKISNYGSLRKSWDNDMEARLKPEPGYLQKERLQVPEKLADCLRRKNPLNPKAGWVHRETNVWFKGSPQRKRKHSKACAKEFDGTPLSHESIIRLFNGRVFRPNGLCVGLESSVLNHAPVKDKRYSKRAAYPVPLGLELVQSYRHKDSLPRVIIDPFIGTGTTAICARQLGWHCIGIDLDISCAIQRIGSSA